MRYIFLSILVIDSFNLLDLRAVNHILCKKLVLLTKLSLLMSTSPFFMFCLNFEPRVNHYMFRRKKLRLTSINILKLDWKNHSKYEMGVFTECLLNSDIFQGKFSLIYDWLGQKRHSADFTLPTPTEKSKVFHLAETKLATFALTFQ